MAGNWQIKGWAASGLHWNNEMEFFFNNVVIEVWFYKIWWIIDFSVYNFNQILFFFCDELNIKPKFYFLILADMLPNAKHNLTFWQKYDKVSAQPSVSLLKIHPPYWLLLYAMLSAVTELCSFFVLSPFISNKLLIATYIRIYACAYVKI